MAEVLVLRGHSAFSDFRILSLQSTIGAKAIRANWIYYVYLLQPLPSQFEPTLEQLVTGRITLDFTDARKQGPSTTTDNADTSRQYYVTPRPGTVSPWSSKATSIAHVCGLEQYVRRIERGLFLSMQFPPSWDGEDAGYVDLLHDRMTQVGISGFSLALLIGVTGDQHQSSFVLDHVRRT